MNAITEATKPSILESESPKQAMMVAPRASAMQVQATAAASPDNLLVMAMQQGASVETLERLLALKERHDANVARQAYTEAMARAKLNPPTIKKDKHVAFATQKGVTQYDHATLGNIVNKVVAWLGEHGFSHAWDIKQLQGGRIAVTCTLTHSLGHREHVTLEASRDDSGTKNDIQAVSSAVTYLERYTLLAITGLATEDQDDDGQTGGAPILTPIEVNRIEAAGKVTRSQSVNELTAVSREYTKKFNELKDREGYPLFVEQVQARGKFIRKRDQATAEQAPEESPAHA